MNSKQKDELVHKKYEPFYITESGLAALKEKLAHLKRVLPDRAAEAARTAAYGDRSENDEYKQAKGALRRTSAQILTIEDQIKRAAIIKQSAGAAGAVSLGSTVTLELIREPSSVATYQDVRAKSAKRDEGISSDISRSDERFAAEHIGVLAGYGVRGQAPMNGTEKVFQIVGPHETDPAKGRISHLSPLGAALMHKKPNDVITLRIGAGEQTYRIVKIG